MTIEGSSRPVDFLVMCLLDGGLSSEAGFLILYSAVHDSSCIVRPLMSSEMFESTPATSTLKSEPWKLH